MTSKNEETSGDGDSWRRMLTARPVRNRAARVERPTGDCVTVYVKRDRPAYLVPPLSWIVAVRPERRVTLDRLGTAVWALCDGNRTVENVVDEFAASHDLTFHEARVAVTGYLRALLRRGVMAMVMEQR